MSRADLLPCPFCGAEMEPFGPAQHNHPRNACWLASVKVVPEEYEQWNARAALAAQAPVRGPYVATNQEELQAMLDRIVAEQAPVQGEQVEFTDELLFAIASAFDYCGPDVGLSRARAAIDAARKAGT